MVKVKLLCGVYGEGSVFSVEIEHNANVEALREAIFYKKRYNQQRKIDSSMLTLFLARKTVGEETKWLLDDDNLDALLRGDVDEEYANIRSSWILNEQDWFGENFEPVPNEIHVLVELLPQMTGKRARKKPRLVTAAGHTKLNAIATTLQIEQWQVGGLALAICDIEPDFPDWKKNRSVVFVGAPGVGKSMLVVLFAFYMALCQRKRVVLLRKLKQKGFTVFYLDPEHQQYWRKEEAEIIDLDELKHRDFELCLDGFKHREIESNFGRLARFRLLATSAQYEMKNDDTAVLRQCIVPFWSKTDLRTIGMHHQWPESDINDRFYFSG